MQDYCLATDEPIGIPRATTDNVGISVTWEPEYDSFVGQSGIEEYDRADEKWVSEQLEQGNPWAWCIICVKATYRDVLEGTDYLGGCSYGSERDFIEGGDYYPDMVANAIAEINEQIEILEGGE